MIAAIARDGEFRALLELSAALGADPLRTQAAGGNTSIKHDGVMWIKASGTWLADAITRDIMTPVLIEPLRQAMLTATGVAPSAGSIADLCRQLGGVVFWIGKPFQQIYQMAASLSGVAYPRGILCVGDSVEHDIVGARRFGAMAALVRTGILASLSEGELATEIARHGVVPDFVLDDLSV